MEKDFYATLGISKNATEDEIRKAYKKMALKFHPDKNKTVEAGEQFKNIAEAYEVLNDKQKRATYDKYGHAGLKGGTNINNDAHNGNQFAYTFHCDPQATFTQFFGSSNPFENIFSTSGMGGVGHGMPSNGYFPDNDTEDMATFVLGGGHNANSVRFRNHHQRASNSSRLKTKRQDDPVQHDLLISLDDIAVGCTKRMKISRNVLQADGLSTTKEDKVLTINIKPGYKAGTTITFAKEGDQAPNRVPADVVFVLRDKPHPIFKREGSDIRYTAQVSLKEALCGTKLEIPTLSGEKRVLRIKDIIKPNYVHRVHGHGLPLPKVPTKRGDLVVAFEIKFPDQLDDESRATLRSVLP